MHRPTILALVACLTWTSGACAVTLAELTGKRSLFVGPLVLSNFRVAESVGFGSEAIAVEAEAFLNEAGSPLLGVRFSSRIVLSSDVDGPKDVAYDLGFDVTLTDPDFVLEGMTHATVGNAEGSGTMSNVTIALPPDVTEITDATPFTPQRSALAGRPVPEFPWTSDVSELFARASRVHVEQTVRMMVGDRSDPGSARLNHFDVLFWLAPSR